MNENTMNNEVTMAGEFERALLANRYRIIKQLGQGGMGSVWLAEDTQLDGKLFAIKMLPSILVSNKRAYQQLKAEALVAMKLVHPNIVQMRAFEENNNNPFLVMDYIDGETLDDWLGDGELGMGKGEEDIVRLLKPIAEALDYAHTEGVVHRDIKPSNVMIRKDGRLFIMDFGIAREIQETMTRVTGRMSSGTLMYMSPEQLHGLDPDKSQDIYSFAAMVYECLTGKPPFYRGQIEHQIDHDDPAPLSGDIAIASSVMAGLAKKPDDRPKSCVAVLEKKVSRIEPAGERPRREGEVWPGRRPLRAAKSLEACERPREPQSEQRVRTTSQGNTFGKVAAIAVFALGLVGGVWYWQDAKEKDEARIALELKAEAERKAAEEARRIAAEKAKAEKAEAERKQKEEAVRIAAEKAKAEERARKAEEARLAAQKEAERNAELEVFRLSSKVKSAHELIDQESSEIKEVFATEISAFEDIRDSGDEAKEKSRYVITTNFYTQALSSATALKISVTNYRKAKKFLLKIERAKERADEVNASESLPGGYKTAQAAQNAAVEALRQKLFDECMRKGKEAESLFISLRTDVVNSVLGIAEGHKDNERWDKCKQEAEKVLSWDANNAKANDLKNEALNHLVPSLKVIATIDGEEVSGAKLNDGRKDHFLPITWKLERDKKYGPYAVSCKMNGKQYEGIFDMITCDWSGAKRVNVILKEACIPSSTIYAAVSPRMFRDADVKAGRNYKAGSVFAIGEKSGVDIKMIGCCRGSFTMGAADYIYQFYRGCDKAHQVSIDYDFWISSTEITQKQWATIMKNTGVGLTTKELMFDIYKDTNLYNFGGKLKTVQAFYEEAKGFHKDYKKDWVLKLHEDADNMPIYYVSWLDAVKFCKRLTFIEKSVGHKIPDGYEYRLPTVEEWEYACRAGCNADWPNGSSFDILHCRELVSQALNPIAWYKGNSGNKPHEVATKNANNWGIYDMLGNVYEWCLGDGDERAPIRGGSYRSGQLYCLPAVRGSWGKGFKMNSLGFRVVLAPISSLH